MYLFAPQYFLKTDRFFLLAEPGRELEVKENSFIGFILSAFLCKRGAGFCGEAISCNWSLAFVGQPLQNQEGKSELEQNFRKSFTLLLTTSVTQKYLAIPTALGLWTIGEAENTLFSDFIKVTVVCRFSLVTDSPAFPSQGFSVVLEFSL